VFYTLKVTQQKDMTLQTGRLSMKMAGAGIQYLAKLCITADCGNHRHLDRGLPRITVLRIATSPELTACIPGNLSTELGKLLSSERHIAKELFLLWQSAAI
jgi:hypothetical protein